jgi:Arc/MetJ-type ribon-helix-helix transcriptional regulator
VDTQIEKRRFANRTHAIEFALQQLIEGEKPIAHVAYAQPSRDSGFAIAESPGKVLKKK